MASIVRRGHKFCVVYTYIDAEGKRKQKWETFHSLPEAQSRRLEVEYKQDKGTFIVPQCQTVEELLNEFIDLYGKDKWTISTHKSNVGLIEHYVTPFLGSMKLQDVTVRVIERYYQKLLKTKAVDSDFRPNHPEYLTAATVRSVHKVLHCCFEQAVKWELLEKNPCKYATVPKHTQAEREIWTAETMFHAMDLCKDNRLKISINLAFSCSLRIGELLGLTWDCVDISPKSIEDGTASIYVNKELQRVDRDTMDKLDSRDVIFKFPTTTSKTKTLLILKKPKTATSTRKVFLPKTVANMLIDWKKKQEEAQEILGAEYQNFNLVIAGPTGMPTEASTITTAFSKLIKENDLPKVVFHSLRHSSITYKLKLNGGDVKAVQGDSGHAQVKMVTDVYSHILDDDRKANAQLFEDAFYSGKGTTPPRQTETVQAQPGAGSVDAATLLKILTNPETAALLKVLANGLGQ